MSRDKSPIIGSSRMMVPIRLIQQQWPPNDAYFQPGTPRLDAILETAPAEGIREPLTINLQWQVIDGNHRLAAARMLGLEMVPVRVWTGTEFLP